MLTKSLKLHGHEYLDPIFVGMCGLISAFFGFFKALFEKKLVILTEKEERKIHSQSRLRPYVSAKDW